MSRCQIRLVTSNFGTSTGTICVLFDDSCSYDDGNTLSSSLIDNRQFETDINTSFVDSDSCQLARPPGLCSRGWETVPRHGRARLRHGRGDTDLTDSLEFVSHSIDLNRFVCFLLCMVIVQ